MEQLIIGGAVRDTLLGRPVKDMDFVWVGATPQHMIDLGMTQVGADFPVFLDRNGNEHALARKERKVRPGYTGFECTFDHTVTLKDDQMRRDLTINQLAVPIESWDTFVSTKDRGLVIDSFGGLQDLSDGILRHTSPHFVEDEIRVLRVARFAARYGFVIASDTIELMADMAHQGVLDHLVPERIVAELDKILMERSPEKFFESLPPECVLAILPDIGTDTDALRRAGIRECSRLVRWGAMFISTRPADAESIMNKIAVPNDVRQIVQDVAFVESLPDFDHRTAFSVIKRINAVAQPERLQRISQVLCLVGDRNWHAVEFIDRVIEAVPRIAKINFNSLTHIQRTRLRGKEIGEALDRLRAFEVERLFARL